MCCPLVVDIMIRVSNKAYRNTCGCLLTGFKLTPLNIQLHEQNAPMEKEITPDVHCQCIQTFTVVIRTY